MGQDLEGPEVSGVGKSEATIHHSLRSLSQLLVSPCIKPGHTAGVCAVTGDLITFGSQWITLEGAFHASTLSCHRTLGKLRQQVCGSRLSADQGHRGSRSAGISIPAAPGEAGPGFPRKGSVVTCMYLDIYMGG